MPSSTDSFNIPAHERLHLLNRIYSIFLLTFSLLLRISYSHLSNLLLGYLESYYFKIYLLWTPYLNLKQNSSFTPSWVLWRGWLIYSAHSSQLLMGVGSNPQSPRGCVLHAAFLVLPSMDGWSVSPVEGQCDSLLHLHLGPCLASRRNQVTGTNWRW